MNADLEKANRVGNAFLRENYDYLWLKAMLRKAGGPLSRNATLLTGSSHALYGVKESAWSCAVNCSMHSQDLYYDFLCARHAILSTKGEQKFQRCFILLSSFSACFDLSLSTSERELRISRVFDPIFHDAHNWKTPACHDPWDGFEQLPEGLKRSVEDAAVALVQKKGTYFSGRSRMSMFDLRGSDWHRVPEELRLAMGQVRAAAHNKLFRHSATIAENREIFKEYVHFLHMNGILPVAVLMPYTKAYGRFVLPEMIESVLEMVDSAPDEIHYVDLNEGGVFKNRDFVDTDHLNEQGAEKASKILTDIFGR